ncbi:molybdopterin-dependent oxidoreductase-like protein [Paraburkholderia caballeronis]|uniref:molybdopterin-dependent oxidoreductase n=1 Tax=Paraburkholderia caballeronis TaxID=416943 RepID=UPI001065EF5F|nr:molybdopterin-dependent oxidoreductase [Paraburkholderia caballeronis]TDV34280.1 molybdopterin-dependent oxidoreductase-like protein [Paraburkholderia caballeronis]
MDIAQTARHAVEEIDLPGTLRLTGCVLRPQAISLDALRRFPAVMCAPFDLRCYTTQRFIRTVEPYRGVLLTDLLQHAGLRCDAPGDFKRMIFLAVGHDGYAVTFSWHELFNTPVGQQAVVAYECGGNALDEDDGAPVLFSGADLVPAPRHLKRLARIETRVLAP